MTRAPGTTSLPVLDMSQLDRGDAEAANFRTALRTATHDVGFFYLVGHGIPEDVTARAFAEATRFFALPLDDKRRVEMLRSPQFRGYTRTGGELTQGQVDWREQIDIGAERAPSDDPAAPVYMRLEGPNLWPEAQPELRAVFTDWEHRCAAVGAEAPARLGAVPRQSGRRLRQRLRRPPLHPDQARPLPRPRRARAGRRRAQGSRRAHAADDRAGQGRPAGRHLERVGRRPRPARRVRGQHRRAHGVRDRRLPQGHRPPRRLAPPGQTRLSIPFFFNPALDSSDAAASTFRPELAVDAPRGHARTRATVISGTFGDNLLKARLRAHPDVAARHHADLVTPAAKTGP